MKKILFKFLYTIFITTMVAIMWYLLGYKMTLLALLIANYVEIMFK
jgi:hypothetical protein